MGSYVGISHPCHQSFISKLNEQLLLPEDQFAESAGGGKGGEEGEEYLRLGAVLLDCGAPFSPGRWHLCKNCDYQDEV